MHLVRKWHSRKSRDVRFEPEMRSIADVKRRSIALYSAPGRHFRFGPESGLYARLKWVPCCLSNV
jgi:hypothetical protein